MKKTRIPQAISFVLAISVIVAYFLPYICSTAEYSAYLDSRATEKVYSSADLSVGDLKDMSLFEYTKVYFQAGKEIFRDQSAGTFYAVLIGSICAFAILVLLCALGKKPILMFVFSLLMGGAFYATNWDFLDRHIMPDSNRVWGIAHEIILPISIGLVICAIWLLIAKRAEKKTAN